MARKSKCDRCKTESEWSTDGLYFSAPRGWSGLELRSGSTRTADILLCPTCTAEVNAFFMPSADADPQLSRSEKFVQLLFELMYDVACDAISNNGT